MKHNFCIYYNNSYRNLFSQVSQLHDALAGEYIPEDIPVGSGRVKISQFSLLQSSADKVVIKSQALEETHEQPQKTIDSCQSKAQKTEVHKYCKNLFLTYFTS